MSVSAPQRVATIALIGNPNTGKSTLFNALCGVRQRVGNYPGVTVEMKQGHFDFQRNKYSLLDLPGTYSLAPRSPDEVITIDVLLGRRADVGEPDAIMCIVDAGNLQRNLYLVSQVLELGRPTIVVLNMMDSAESRGLKIDVATLSTRLGVPVVPMQANRRIGLEKLRDTLSEVMDSAPRQQESPFPPAFVEAVDELGTSLTAADLPLPRYLVERLLLDTNGYLIQSHLDGQAALVGPQITALRERLATLGHQVPAVEAVSRYQWVGRILDGVLQFPAQRPVTFSDRIDRVLTHKLLGSIVFLVLMAVVFMSIFFLATWPMEWIETGVGALSDFVSGLMPDGALQSLVVHGIIGGVGNVIVFLPQIFILFLFIAMLEDCGYMARAAYLMDKLMSRVGLSGKSFIPLLSSFACAIPGIMAARVIENRRDRLITVLVAPLMTCSARLPVYMLLISAFFSSSRVVWGVFSLQIITKSLIMMAMYLLGIVAAVAVALVLRRTLLKGTTPPFVMELPSYKVPSAKLVVARAGERGWEFVRRAGTMIVAMTVIVWAAGYYPRHVKQIDAPHRQELAALAEKIETQQKQAESAPDDKDAQAQLGQLQDEKSEIQNKIAGEHLRQSYLGRAGRTIEPLVRPLGWDWRIGCAAIASFPAREVVIGTLGVIYNLGEDVDDKSLPLREQLQRATWDNETRHVYNVPVALSLMVFFALCAQCASTLVVLKRETNSWRWPIFTFVYMTTLAYLGAWATYQIGMLFVG